MGITIVSLIAVALILFGLFGAFGFFKKKEVSQAVDRPHPTNPNLKYCRHCNNEVAVTAVTCPKCGGSVAVESPDAITPEVVISFLIPIVGIIIYANNSKSNPERARKALNAALLGFLIGIIGTFLLF